MLKNQLYPCFFNRFIRILWDHFHDNFIDLMQVFEESISSDPKNDADIISKSINVCCLLKFFIILINLYYFKILMLKFKDQCINYGYLEAKTV